MANWQRWHFERCEQIRFEKKKTKIALFRIQSSKQGENYPKICHLFTFFSVWNDFFVFKDTLIGMFTCNRFAFTCFFRFVLYLLVLRSFQSFKLSFPWFKTLCFSIFVEESFILLSLKNQRFFRWRIYVSHRKFLFLFILGTYIATYLWWEILWYSILWWYQVDSINMILSFIDVFQRFLNEKFQFVLFTCKKIINSKWSNSFLLK